MKKVKQSKAKKSDMKITMTRDEYNCMASALAELLVQYIAVTTRRYITAMYELFDDVLVKHPKGKK